jgi:hypothetical protein
MAKGGWLSRKDTFALEAMKVILGFHPDRDAAAVAEQAFKVSDELVKLLDAPESGEDGNSILSEFDDSPQGVSDAVLGRKDVELPDVLFEDNIDGR